MMSTNQELSPNAMYDNQKSIVEWAFDLSESYLAESLPRRWRHVQGAARQARTLSAAVGEDAELLEATAVLHDIGYSPALVVTDFHPLDGANFLRRCNAPERLISMVAHHTCAIREARKRNLGDELEVFYDEESLTRDALWYCDITTTPDGLETTAEERIREIKERYGAGHIVTEFMNEADVEVLAAVARVKKQLGLANSKSM